MSDCPHTDTAVAWALHVLEPDEEDRVAAHLPTCPTCRAVVAETEETLAALGAGVEQEEPPAGLRNRILDESARTPQEAPRVPSRRPTAGGPGPTSGSRPTPNAGTRPMGKGPSRHGRPSRSLRGRVVAVAAAALVALGAIAGLGVYSSQLAAQRDAETARADSLVAMMQQLATPGTAHAFLAAGEGQPAVAAVLATPAGQQMVLPVALPANPHDHVYVLWGLPAEGTPAPLGTFDVGDDDTTVHSVGSSPDGTGFVQFAISLEPGRVAPASPSDVAAIGRAEI